MHNVPANCLDTATKALNQTLPRPAFEAPLYIAWEVTLRCNARCIHCYSESGPEVRHPAELSTADALDVIDQLADAGLLVLAFSGGEPLLRSDIYELIERAAQHGLVVSIATNGAPINERVATRLKASGASSVTVSLDGATAEVHDHFRRTRGLFNKAMRAIPLLTSHGLRVVVGFTPTILNHAEGPAVVELAERLGAAAVNMSEYVPAGRGTRELALTPELQRDVVAQWIEMRRTYADRIRIIWHDCRVSLLVPPEEQDRYSGCGAGRLTARLKVDGTLTPCVFLPNAAGNLLETPFREIWQNSPFLHAIRDRRTIQDGNCGTCQHKYVCGGCRAVSMTYYGDPFKGDPLCWVVPEQPPADRTVLPVLPAPTARHQ